MAYKKWTVARTDKEYAASVSQQYNMNPFAVLLALSRGIEKPEEIEAFLSSQYSCCTDPFDFPDMRKAVNRINEALDSGEHIAVVGDFDADGVTSTAIMYEYLRDMGGNVSYYIPSRHTEGYGLSTQIIDKLRDSGVTLIVTVDNGINCVEETEYAGKLGIDLVITDHHQQGKVLPNAVAVVNPHRNDCRLEFKDYAGVGVAFKLICALSGEDSRSLFYDFVDLVAIGTIGDVVPLKGENRDFVRAGLEIIRSHPRIGIDALIKSSGLGSKRVGSLNVAFSLVPRINAAGRMSEAVEALDLLLCEDYEEAGILAEKLERCNGERHDVEREIMAQAVENIDSMPEHKYDRVLVCSGEGWHPGVIGIVTSKLMEKYGKPCIVISEDGDKARGSGRSMEGFSLYDALSDSADILTNFGGHTLAAGFGIMAENIDEFRKRINEYAANIDMPVPVQHIDFKLNPKYIDRDIMAAIRMIEPFGSGNPQPVFGLYGAKLLAINPVANGKHLRLVVEKSEVRVTVMKFGVGPDAFNFRVGDFIDLAVTLEESEYNGEIQLSVFAKNIRISCLDENSIFEGINTYETVKRNETLTPDKAGAVLPDRNFIAAVFKTIKANCGWRYGVISLCRELGDDGHQLAKVLIAVDALKELKIVETDKGGIIRVLPRAEKANLEDSEILNKVRDYTV
ncbi:MAG: single-stranded-DNA-specific exonuclease RecJ [Clostridiales bacterium]|nr:single-stranded-DNA-specific exonuclease RecJ [Clostridiales bacterium]